MSDKIFDLNKQKTITWEEFWKEFKIIFDEFEKLHQIGKK